MRQFVRRPTASVMVGSVCIGSEAPVSVQSMTKADPADVNANLQQIEQCAQAGADIIRCAVPSVAAVSSFSEIVRRSPLPVVADIHFDSRIALAAIAAGAAKIRINPGNMDNRHSLAEIAKTAAAAGCAIRVGVNSGSIKHRDPRDPRPVPEALAEEALNWVQRLEDSGFTSIVISLKSHDVSDTIAANRRVAAQCSYPLHLGVTSAGPREYSLLRSAVALGALLVDGIGDTIRLSFTGSPVDEIIAGQDLLRAAGLLHDRARLISCPTCGRCSVDLLDLVRAVNERLEEFPPGITVAVMGCEVNGPGEAREADIGIAAAGGRLTVFQKGEPVGKVEKSQALERLLQIAAGLQSSREDGGPAA